MTKSYINLAVATDLESRKICMSVDVQGYGISEFGNEHHCLHFLHLCMKEEKGIHGSLTPVWYLCDRARQVASGWFARFERSAIAR